MGERAVWDREVAGSIPVFPTIFALEALLAMRRICNPETGSSILSWSTKFTHPWYQDVKVYSVFV